MTPEFAREYRIDTIGDVPRTVSIAATAEECAALAQRFGLIAIDHLEADAALHRAGEIVSATGRLRAAVVQACVASGEPLAAAIDAPFDVRFVPEDAGATAAELELDANDLDEMSYGGGAIDLGEAVAETLSLTLDPFPRGPNADEALKTAGVLGEGETGPFAVLKGLLGTRR